MSEEFKAKIVGDNYDIKRREALKKIDNAKFDFGKSSLPSDVDLGVKVATLFDPRFWNIGRCHRSQKGDELFNFGICIGGDNPLSAGAIIAAVFAVQGIGILAAAIVSTVTIVAFQSTITPNDYSHFDYVWRIVTGIGAIPGVVALYFRLKIPETPRFTMDLERNVNQAVQDIDTVLKTGLYKPREQEVIVKVEAPKASFTDFFGHSGKWENEKVLFGTAFTWFVLDIAFCGITLNSNIILNQIEFLGDGKDPYETLFKTSVGNIILGSTPNPTYGFAWLTALFIVLGFGYLEYI
ncbi:3447_t:CDS:2 [Dentiscutata heterogama]|uniref:3447_t:CDS:1 n=1 Tax=Dentiscutata heterogama TaxID=1316150 RepID=A0ACA9NDI2_9GLOM|nr:3447_t:CDS:2 [Dentiscutata heterogama]